MARTGVLKATRREPNAAPKSEWKQLGMTALWQCG